MPVDTEIVVIFGKSQYRVPSAEMSGGELRRIFGVPPTEDLFRAQGTKAIEPPLDDNTMYPIKNGEHFISAPKHVNFGAA